MVHERIQAIIGTALVDPRFRRGLLGKWSGVLEGFGLTEDEAKAVSSFEANTLEAFAGELDRWMLTMRCKGAGDREQPNS